MLHLTSNLPGTSHLTQSLNSQSGLQGCPQPSCCVHYAPAMLAILHLLNTADSLPPQKLYTAENFAQHASLPDILMTCSVISFCLNVTLQSYLPWLLYLKITSACAAPTFMNPFPCFTYSPQNLSWSDSLWILFICLFSVSFPYNAIFMRTRILYACYCIPVQ